jgi:hypothetical protein
MTPEKPGPAETLCGYCRYFNTGIIILFSLYFLLLPAAIAIRQLSDPHLRSAGIPRSAWQLHQTLSSQYEKWARERLASNRAVALSTADISGTEWPLFGSVFYLWATESLQEAWNTDHSLSPQPPNVYARGAIEAATSLVIDPTQANWVKIHWGNNYLKKENVFYRMLVISALTSHAVLTGDKQHLDLLRDQADSLSAELDKSPHGLLDDYPGECYPGDVLTAIAMIHKADKVLGADHSGFVSHAIRGFQDKALDERGLVPYFANAGSGMPVGTSRGCDNSYVTLFAPGIWPDQARKWYELYTQYFWQRGACAGFREFPNDLAGNNWYLDVDSGPVWGGYGCAACAFGVGAARVNGHFEHAWPLTAEMVVTSWPLPNGTRLFPRLLSNAADAPYLGEAGILFNLTRMPADGVSVETGGSLPEFVIIFVAAQIVCGLTLPAMTILGLRRWQKRRHLSFFPYPGLQTVIWSGLVFASVLCLCSGKPAIAIILLLSAQFFPRTRKHSQQALTQT